MSDWFKQLRDEVQNIIQNSTSNNYQETEDPEAFLDQHLSTTTPNNENMVNQYATEDEDRNINVIVSLDDCMECNVRIERCNIDNYDVYMSSQSTIQDEQEDDQLDDEEMNEKLSQEYSYDPPTSSSTVNEDTKPVE